MQLTRRFTDHADELLNEFDRLFRHTVGRQPERGQLPREFSLYETEQSWIFRSDLPGFRKEDLNVEVVEGVLKLEGSTSDEKLPSEIHHSFRLPRGVHAEGITARLDHGVLELVLPKSEPQSPEPRRIEIN